MAPSGAVFVCVECLLLADTVEKLENQIGLNSRPIRHFSNVRFKYYS